MVAQTNGTTSTTALAVVKPTESALTNAPVAAGLMRPVANPEAVLEVLEQTRKMLAKTLTDGVDYGVIPGTDKDKKKPPKKVLFKPGAEKVAFSFGCRPEFTVDASEIDHERVLRFKTPWVEAQKPRNRDLEAQMKEEGRGRNRQVNGEWQWQEKGDGYEETTGLYRYVIRCRLVRYDGVVVGEGIGSCSTLESKYRSRPTDVENTVLKMAEKRAFIAAVLTAFGLSEAFTQDLVDEADHRADHHEERQQAASAPARDPVADTEKEEVRRLQLAAIVELDRMKVGANMDRDEKKAAQRVVLERANGGKAPRTTDEWRGVLADLRAEPTPMSTESGVQPEPGDDADVEDPPT